MESVLGGVLILLGLSVWRPLVDGRYASVVWGPLFPLLGAGLALIPIRLVVAALLATGASSVALSAAPNHPDTQAVIAAVPFAKSSDLVSAMELAADDTLAHGRYAEQMPDRIAAAESVDIRLEPGAINNFL